MQVVRHTTVVLGAVVALIGVVVVGKTVAYEGHQIEPPRLEQPVQAPDEAATRLGKAIRFKTISDIDPAREDSAQFLGFHAFLEQTYPKVHATLTRELVPPHSLLYTWEGTDPTLEPILLSGHMDVVPIDPKTRETWVHPPFGGVIDGGFVWGRGAIDDKMAILGILEATEALIARGYRPTRTVYYAFGADEEISGKRGAAVMSRMLRERLEKRGVEKLLWAMDEGHVITDGIVPGVDAPVAFIGLAEKGYLTLSVEAKSPGGHSSTPPPHTAAGELAQAIVKLESNPLPAALDGPTLLMFEYLGPHMKLPERAIFANLWMFSSVVQGLLEGGRSTNANLRTTTAVTMLSGSPKDNVLPQVAQANVNFRLHPRDSVASVTEHVQRVVGSGLTVRPMDPEGNSEPSPVSRHQALGYRHIEASIRAVWPDYLVAPGLVIGATDGRHYVPVAQDVYRFVPIIMKEEDLERMHGNNERIGIENYHKLITFFGELLKRGSQK